VSSSLCLTRQTNLLRWRLVERLKARIRQGLHSRNLKYLGFEVLIELLSLSSIIPRSIHIEWDIQCLVDFESGVHAFDQPRHPDEYDRCAYQHKAKGDLRDDEAARRTGAHSCVALTSLERCKEIEFPGCANRNQR